MIYGYSRMCKRKLHAPTNNGGENYVLRVQSRPVCTHPWYTHTVK